MPRSLHRRWIARQSCRALAFLPMALASAGISPASAQTIPTDPQATCTVSASVFATWFQSGTPSLNGVVNPANSITFPNTPNCSFYQWSMQMFLWLTSPAPTLYGGGDFIFDSPVFYDVSPADASGKRILIPHVPGLIRFFGLRAAQVGPRGLPVVVDKAGRLLEVAPTPIAPSGKPLILNRAGKSVEVESATIESGKPVFRDAAGKVIARAKPLIQAPSVAFVRPQLNPALTVQKILINGIPIFLDPSGNPIEVEQGQADDSVLEAQNGSLVYFATMVNDVYAYFLTGIKDGAIPSPGGNQTNAQFPTTQANLNAITAFGAAHGKTSFVDADALAVEVKTAWVEATSLANPNDYIKVQGTIPTYDRSNPNQWIPNGQKTVQLALVGMHVVGSTNGHPEMVWATFEHFNNAPNAAYSYNSTTGPKTVAQNTAGTWLFSKSGSTGPFNVAHMTTGAGNSIVPASGQTISPSDTLRTKPWGAASNAAPNPVGGTTTPSASNTDIISLNHNVGSMMPSGDVRNNYFFMGATWTINGAPSNSNFGNPGNPGIVNGRAVGTSQLENTTMETYQQGPSTFNQFGSNCFECHNGNTVTVSHVFFGPSGPPTGIQPLF
jgi:hypothetical protein